MHCPSCGAATPAEGKFCIECGSALPRTCPACNVLAPEGAKFCAECGTSLTGAATPVGGATAHGDRGADAVTVPVSTDGAATVERAAPESLGGDAERRQLTVLFADLVGSTQLSGRIDPEDLREVIGAYVREAERVVRQFDGHVANYLGDGILAYFGYPRAHEDDARRAGLAGLGIADALVALNERFSAELDVTLAVRVGIHTGPAVIGGHDGGGPLESMAVGETVNLASRIQTSAEPGTVVVSSSTERLLRQHFECEALGAREYRGIRDPVHVWRLLRTSGVSDRFVAPGADLTPLVGREGELQVLLGRWAEVGAGKPRVVLLRGEAGFGKSRLVRAFRHRVGTDAAMWLECRGSSFNVDSAFRPIIEMAPQLFGFPEGAGPASVLAAIEATLDRAAVPRMPAVALLATLLGVPLDGTGYEPPPFSPQVTRQRTLEALALAVLAACREQPVVLVVEDVHWIDQSSLDFLELLTETSRDARLFLLVIGRADSDLPLVAQTEIVLRRLPRDEVERIVAHITGNKPLPDPVLRQIIERADGNPLYVEELTRTALESGELTEHDGAYRAVGGTAMLEIPASLQESLMARLDRIAPAKTVVQVGSAIGRQFPYEVLRDVLRMEDAELTPELERLCEANILIQRGRPPASTYAFKHALVQDAAYQSMTRKTRRRCHERIAGVLQDRPDTRPEVLAHHFTESGAGSAAVEQWRLAAQSALEAFALTESRNHLERGLSLLPSLPEPDRNAYEMGLRATLGVPLMLTQGFAAPAVETNYGELLELCREAGDAGVETLFPALWGLWTYYEVSAQYARAEEMGQRLLDLAERVPVSGVRLGGHIAYGAARFMRGDVAEARRHFEAGLELYDRAEHAPLALLFGQDGGAMCASFLTWVHAHEGEAELGAMRAEQSLELCRELEQPATWGFVEAVLASYNCLIGEYQRGEQHARRVMDLAEEQGMRHWAAQGRTNLGWALQGQGRADEAVDQIREGLAGFEITGTRAALTYFKGALAEAEIRRGRPDDALRVLDELDEFVAESDERFYEAELRRLRGSALLARGEPGDESAATAAYEQARGVAREQGAAGFLRRAEESLQTTA